MSTPTLRFRNTGLNLRSIPIVLYLIGFTEFSTGIPHPTKVLVVSENLVIYYEEIPPRSPFILIPTQRRRERHTNS